MLGGVRISIIFVLLTSHTNPKPKQLKERDLNKIELPPV